ncbi:MAG: hypothetical protein HYZ31_06665 [Gammaproteobacteria bacterium]|nr:hypothetical protein [Gammaproteobacteria bacterium]
MNKDVQVNPNLEILIPIADALGELRELLVFVGGCATGLLVTTQRAQIMRPTKDVDVVVQVATLAEYHAMEKAVKARGFKHDISQDAPICRWVRNGVMLDLMPSEAGILGFHNYWYPLACRTASRVNLTENMEINLIAAPVFIATKLEAFHDRGKADYLASHDLEDLITVIDGRAELIQEIRLADDELKNYLSAEMTKLLSDRAFQLAMPGHLPSDAASQARLPELMHRIRTIAQLN